MICLPLVAESSLVAWPSSPAGPGARTGSWGRTEAAASSAAPAVVGGSWPPARSAPEAAPCSSFASSG